MIELAIDKVWTALSRVDAFITEHNVYLAWRCHREGHEIFADIDVCDNCTRIICVRCRKYLGTVKGQE